MKIIFRLKYLFWALLFAFGLFLVVVLAGGAYFVNLITNPGPLDQKSVVEVPAGSSTVQIAESLKEKKIISSSDAFIILTKILGKPLLAGAYNIKEKSSLFEVYNLISSGETAQIKITIPEGYRLEQIAQVLADKGLADYADFVKRGEELEGTLFPDTYYFSSDVSTDGIINKMRENYEKRTLGLALSKEDLVIASIVEREAVTDEERPLIAGIYKNRIARGMRLEADPTVQYGKDNIAAQSLSPNRQKTYDFWQPISLADYKGVNSKFNTYLFAGLPPGPICNPGLASLKATVNYQNHDYLYFLQNGGKIYPARTEADHNKNRINILGSKISE